MIHLLLLLLFVGVAQARETFKYDDAMDQVSVLALNQKEALKKLEDHIYFSRDSFTAEEKQNLINALTQARENICAKSRPGMFSGWSWLVVLGFAIKAAIHYKGAESALNLTMMYAEMDAFVSAVKYCGASFAAAICMQAIYDDRVKELFAEQRAAEKHINYMISLLQ